MKILIMLIVNSCIQNDYRSKGYNVKKVNEAKNYKQQIVVATLNNQKEKLISLLSSDCIEYIEVGTKDKRTPLMHAVYNKNLDIVKILLDNGAEIFKGDSQGNTPFCNAEGEILNLMIDFLKDKGKLVNILNIELSNNNREKVIEEILSKIEIQSLSYYDKYKIIYNAYKYKNLKVIDFLNLDINVRQDNITLLMHAARERDKKAITSFIELGADVNLENNGATAVTYAILDKYIRIEDLSELKLSAVSRYYIHTYIHTSCEWKTSFEILLNSNYNFYDNNLIMKILCNSYNTSGANELLISYLDSMKNYYLRVERNRFQYELAKARLHSTSFFKKEIELIYLNLLEQIINYLSEYKFSEEYIEFFESVKALPLEVFYEIAKFF